ncbi:hypothetical protein [Streptomyces europaeiscabiei]|nr:hypothetical protein OHB30_18075 [Streptomyces europaeiscabiei]
MTKLVDRTYLAQDSQSVGIGYDGEATVVFQLRPKQQRLVAH